MREITTNFRLQLCIDMVLNRSFWYLNKALLVFQMSSFKEMLCSLSIFVEMLAKYIN